MAYRAVPRGWRVFALVWLGQLVSQLRSGLSEFGLGVWVYQRTSSPLRFALTVLFAALPRIALAPLAGALVDRWDRRWAMILSDAGAALMGIRPSPLLLGVAVFLCFVCIAISDSCSQALWQRKVAPDVQGRVFALRDAIALSVFPLGLLISAPLAEYVFEPLLLAGGPLAGSVARVVGVGAGRGMGLLLIITGVANTLVLVAGYLQPRIRRIKDQLPDALPDMVGAATSPV
jgi:MFS family permease